MTKIAAAFTSSVTQSHGNRNIEQKGQRKDRLKTFKPFWRKPPQREWCDMKSTVSLEFLGKYWKEKEE